MPFTSEWVDPEVALEHGGVTLWHIYKDDDIEQGEREYRFALNPEEDGDMEGGIDVRELPTWREPEHPPYMGVGGINTPGNAMAWAEYHKTRAEHAHVLAVLRDAIDLGMLRQGGVEMP